MLSILELIGAAVVAYVCIKITVRLFGKPKPKLCTYYTYGGKVECIINDINEVEEKEDAFKKKHPKINCGVYNYNVNRDHILAYNLVSLEPIKPSDVIDYESMFTSGEITIDLEAIKRGGR